MDLRKRAEELLRERIKNGAVKQNDNLEEVIQELQIHQIELELQNAELLESQKSLQETQRKYTDLYSFAPVGYFTLNEHGQITECNLKGAQLLNSNHNNLTNRPLIRYLHPDFHVVFLEYLDAVFAGQSIGVCELRLFSQTDESIYVQVQAMAYEQERMTNCLLAMTDITERKKAEERAFSLALKQERLNILSRFVEDAAHEFRTPLLIISMQAHHMRLSQNPDEVQQGYEDVQENIKQVTDLLDTMLEMVRLNYTSEVKPSPVDLNYLVDYVLTNEITHLRNKQIKLELSLDEEIPLIEGDKRRLEQMLLEIVDNAVSFTDGDGAIYISTWSQKNWVQMEIRDTGVGIPEEHLLHVFDMFYRVDNARTKRGFGLGLPIAKTIVEQHGGRITINSNVDEGTSVRVSLPVNLPNPVHSDVSSE